VCSSDLRDVNFDYYKVGYYNFHCYKFKPGKYYHLYVKPFNNHSMTIERVIDKNRYVPHRYRFKLDVDITDLYGEEYAYEEDSYEERDEPPTSKEIEDDMYDIYMNSVEETETTDL